MDQIQQYLPYILNGVGGAILAPLVASLLKGAGLGTIGNIIAGAIGGVAVGAGANAAGMGALLGDSQAMGWIQHLLEGGVGGGIIGVVMGLIKGKPAA